MVRNSRISFFVSDRFAYLIVTLLVIALAFNFKAIFGIACGLGILFVSFTFTRERVTNLFNDTKYLLAIFLVYLLWSVPVFIERHSFSFFEKTLPLLGFPLVVASLRIDESRFIQISRFFIYAVIVSYISSLITAIYNFYYTAPPHGRPSDFFFHVQFATGLFEIHPTFYSILGTIATLLTLHVLTRWPRYIIVIILTGFIFLLNARITIIIQIVLILFHISKDFVTRFGWKGMGFTILLAFILSYTVYLIGNVYDYSHRKMLVNLESAWQTSLKENVSDGDGGVVMRMAIWRNSIRAIKENPWLGSGFGKEDVALLEQYRTESQHYLIQGEFNAHNQLLTYLITFGIVGTFLLTAILVYLLAVSITRKNLIYIEFILIILVCCLTESYMNRLLGISTFAFFNSFLFLRQVHADE